MTTDLLAKGRDITPAEWATVCSHGEYERPVHIRCLDSVLNPLLRQGGARVLIETPPRHGKTMLVGMALPSWYLGLFPKREVIIASATHSLAKRSAHKARGWMMEFGVGSHVHGRGGDLVIMDDMVSGTDALRSEIKLDAVWEFVRDDLGSRMYPWTSVVSILTRWSEDDPHGRILDEMRHENWVRIRLPAIAEDDADLLGRTPGEALWPERFPVGFLENRRETVSTYAWSAIYQQRPTPDEGGIFKRAWLEKKYRPVQGGYALDGHGDVIPHEKIMPVIVVDLAFTEKTSGDWTVIGVGGITRTKPTNLLILDVRRMRIEAGDLIPQIRQAADDWGVRIAYVERAGQQIGFIDLMRREGMPVKTIGRAVTDDLRISGDKESVWHEASPMPRNGRVFLPQAAPWLSDFTHELLVTPNGAYDDQVDVASWMMLLTHEAGKTSLDQPAPVPHAPRRSYAGMQPRGRLRDVM